MATTRRMGLLVHDTPATLDVVGTIDVLREANDYREQRGRPRPYLVEILQWGETKTNGGPFNVRRYHEVRDLDTLLVMGSSPCLAAADDPALLNWLREMAQTTRRVCSVCTGAFILGAAGLLDGRRATTHWKRCAELAARFPRIRVDPDPIFIRDGSFYTSAGCSAGLDLALALVEEDLGHEVALAVARELVLYLQRPGGQSQFSAHLLAPRRGRRPLSELQVWIADHPEADLSVEKLARRAGMSVRNFARVFKEELGESPARYVERVRVENARRQLESERTSVEEVATACGCATTEGSTARTSEAYCGIATPRWSSASRDFDRRATLECLDTIAEAAKTDRDRLHAGAKNDVGEQLDRDFLEEPPSGFVGSGAASLAVRLRQLDCGVRSGRIQFSAADALYDQILAEIRTERATLDPAVNTSRVEPR